MKQFFTFGNDVPVGVGSSYNVLSGFQSSATESLVGSLIGIAGNLRNMRVVLSTAPGVGKSRIYTVYVNGSPTSLTLTISGLNKTAFNNTVDVAVSSLDRVTILSDVTGLAAASIETCAVEFEPTSSNRFITSCGTRTSGAELRTDGTREYITTMGEGLQWSTDETKVRSLVPINATIKGLYVLLDGSPGAGKSYEFSIYKNGSQQASSVFTIADSATSGSATSLGISISPGDELTFSSLSSGTPTARNAIGSIEYQPTTDGEFMVGCTSSANVNTGAVSYGQILSGTNQADIAPELGQNKNNAPTRNVTFSNFRASLTTAPGVGKSWTFNFRRNASNANQTFTISDANTTGTDGSNSDITVDQDVLDIIITPSGTPTATTLRYSMKAVMNSSTSNHLLPILGVGS